MDMILLLARLALAAVFLVSSATKFADRSGFRETLASFGFPAWTAGPLAVAVPLVEIVIAAALLPLVTAWYAAVAALLLLAAFTILIAVSLVRGNKVDCHCFGQISSEPIGTGTLVRNGVLLAIAAFASWQGATAPGLSASAWFTDLTSFQRVVAALGGVGLAAILGEGWLLFEMVRQQGRLLLRLDELEMKIGIGAAGAMAPVQALGLTVGSRAPEFRLEGLHGEILTLESLRRRDRPVLLVFTHPHCAPCASLLPDVGHWQRDFASALSVALIAEGTAADNRSKSAEHGLTEVLVQEKREVAEQYQVNGTPSAVIVQPDGTVGSPLAIGPDAIRSLVAETLGTSGGPANAPFALPAETPAPAPVPQVPALRAGQTAPPMSFDGLDGKKVTLTSFKGAQTMLLFWDPACGFCQQMLPRLQEWETEHPKGSPRLLVISKGAVEANKALGLRSPLALDQAGRAASAFGAMGTPMAVLLDAKGAVASEVAIGADAVLGLADSAATNSR